jgi:hypothetical protein
VGRRGSASNQAIHAGIAAGRGERRAHGGTTTTTMKQASKAGYRGRRGVGAGTKGLMVRQYRRRVQKRGISHARVYKELACFSRRATFLLTSLGSLSRCLSCSYIRARRGKKRNLATHCLACLLACFCLVRCIAAATPSKLSAAAE